MNFTSKKPHYEHLRKKWTAKHRNLVNKLVEKHGDIGRQLTLGGLGGLMLLATPGAGLLPAPHLLASGGQILKDTDRNILLADELKKQVPEEMRALNPAEEEEIAAILSKNFGFKVASLIDGKRLNRTYGMIGGEQHLYRYPGDNLHKHADNVSDWAMYGPAGIAPGLGAWGYFAPSQAEFTEKDKMRERYYIAVQTFLAPGFAERVAEYRDFFKFRKMILVNPETGQSVVTVIGDAGPAEWTGKHLGGSPEVMHFLGYAKGPRKGAALYFFIDDPNDRVPLGPIKVKETES
ncbi:MAG: Uncharacterized protein CEO21_16 [Microgenomates group bacterium Gr01-1014_80]|nr:MAG: Uncharacterized protein CEO21_16 [Microgenomates group bacterium Gr01-1014_80]